MSLSHEEKEEGLGGVESNDTKDIKDIKDMKDIKDIKDKRDIGDIRDIDLEIDGGASGREDGLNWPSGQDCQTDAFIPRRRGGKTP